MSPIVSTPTGSNSVATVVASEASGTPAATAGDSRAGAGTPTATDASPSSAAAGPCQGCSLEPHAETGQLYCSGRCAAPLVATAKAWKPPFKRLQQKAAAAAAVAAAAASPVAAETAPGTAVADTATVAATEDLKL